MTWLRKLKLLGGPLQQRQKKCSSTGCFWILHDRPPHQKKNNKQTIKSPAKVSSKNTQSLKIMWNNVLWSDGTRADLSDHNTRRYVWHKNKKPQHINKRTPICNTSMKVLVSCFVAPFPGKGNNCIIYLLPWKWIFLFFFFLLHKNLPF